MKRYLLSLPVIFFSLCLLAQSTSDFIRVDQFGYLPNSSKVAVVVKPQTGFDVASAASFNPSLGANQYQLRKADNSIVLTGTLASWNGGQTNVTSGDKAWWFDFSSVTTPGTYYVFDIGNNLASFKFDIRDDIYSDVLRAAMRMYFYNRCGAEKKAEFAGTNYADGASFVGANQDVQARSETDRNNAATARDLSGGWWDAGDYNKYVTFTRSVLHQLLDAYEQNNSIWGDNYKIPESGNGIPDIIDEIKWELEWLKKMQNADGSSLIKVGTIKGAPGATLPPSTDNRPRYYYPGSCSSATIVQASVMAHAAIVLGKFPALKTYADDLKSRAIKAYAFYQANPRQTNCDNGNIEAGIADNDLATQDEISVQAAVYLWALTGDNSYRDYVDNNYKKVNVMAGWWGPYDVDFGDALLYYTKLTGATSLVVNDIISVKLGTAGSQDFYKFSPDSDPYRAYMLPSTFHWGHNIVVANCANINYDMLYYNLDAGNANSYKLRSEGLVHYFHGVNALNMVYLTNMNTYGAEKSANQIYHSWYADGSAWDDALTSAKGGPAPGYVPGGPNKSYKDGQGNCVFSPPCNQPEQKSYKDWNGTWPDFSWQITEPAIYYQAAYIKALSRYATLASKEFTLPGVDR